MTRFVLKNFSSNLLSFSCTLTELSYKMSSEVAFLYTKTDISTLCLDGYSVSVQEIVNKAENTIKPQKLTLVPRES